MKFGKILSYIEKYDEAEQYFKVFFGFFKPLSPPLFPAVG